MENSPIIELVPIRCYTCGKIIGHLQEDYNKKKKTMGRRDTLDSLNINRSCCRGNFLNPAQLVLINNKIIVPGLISRRSGGDVLVDPVFIPIDSKVTHGDTTLAPIEYTISENRCYNTYRAY